MDYRAALAEVESWPVAERIQLVQDVQDRLQGQEFDAELTAEVKAELDLRIEEADHNPVGGVPWQVVEPRLLAIYGR